MSNKADLVRRIYKTARGMCVNVLYCTIQLAAC